MYKIEKIVRAPYVCTIPSGGPQAIKCYPDATSFFSKEKKYGYSKRESTLIAPPEATAKDINEIMTKLRNLD